MTGPRPRADEATPAAVAAVPPRSPTLTAVSDGGSIALPLPERGRFVIGRSVQADIVIEHPTLSRTHAALELDSDMIIWEDVGSANGTRVRGRRLATGERVSVGWGEPVELGGVVVIIRPPKTDQGKPIAESDGFQAPHAKEDLDKWIDRVAHTDMSVLLLGETGVGKGFYARRIHDKSHRAAGPFMHINCAALPDQLLESELFGHERGSFTGANAAKPGLLEAASGGSVFLDEVGELSPATQAKLLVALERREVLRVGALKPRPFDVRFLSATNHDLQELAASGRFRTDLFFRIAGLPLLVPPLRDRTDEIAALAQIFVVRAAERLRRPAPALAADAIDALMAHNWPGNVRELMTALDRAVLLADRVLSRAHVLSSLHPIGSRAYGAFSQSQFAQTPAHGIPAPPPSVRSTFQQTGGYQAPGYGGFQGGGFGGPPSSPGLQPPTIVPPPPSQAPPSMDTPAPSSVRTLPPEEAERIRAALDKCAGNQSRAAEVLGISRRTLLHKLDMLGLPRPRKR